MSDKVTRSDEEWRAQLSDEQYRVTRHGGTERAFTGQYWDNHEPGIYTCVCCGAPLFDADTKFEPPSQLCAHEHTAAVCTGLE